MKQVSTRLKLLILLAMFATSGLFAANTDLENAAGVPPENWGADAMSAISKARDKSFDFVHEQVDDVSKRIGMSIFEELTRFELFKVENANFSGSIKVQRRLFPNFDIFDSYTVVDTFELPSSIPLPALIDPTEIIPGVLGGLTVGLYGNMTVTNIRQVSPLKMERLLTWASLKDELTHIDPRVREANDEISRLMKKYDLSKKELIKQINETNKNETEDNDYEVQTQLSKNIIANYLDDSETKARFGKLINVFASPLRLPLSHNGMKRLTPGEIVSYTANGLVQLSGNIGWSYGADLPIVGPRGQISAVTYLNGTYRISIMKEDDKHAQVKLTRIGAHGNGVHFYPLLFGYNLFDGIAVMGLSLSKEVSFAPFRLSLNEARSESFDLVYRYDLTDEDGQECFDQALKGFFACSEENYLLANRNNPSVEKIVSIDSKSKSLWRDTQFELKYLVKRYAKRGKTFTHSKITMPNDNLEDETFFVKNGVASREKSWSTIFGTKEAYSHSFKVSLDEVKYEKRDPEGLTIELNFFLQDDSTTGREFNRYTSKLNELVGLDGIDQSLFEPVPTHIPQEVEDKEGNKSTQDFTARYGDTQIFFKFQLNTPQINKFVFQSDLEFQNILDQVYDQNLKLSSKMQDCGEENCFGGFKFNKAKKMFQAWQALRNSKDLNELHKMLVEFVYLEKDPIRVLNMLRWSVPGEDLAFHYNANNKIFGNRSDSGKIFFTTDTISGKASAKVNFDTIGPRTKSSADAKVLSLESKRLDNGHIEISFELNSTPKFIFFDLKRHTLHIRHDETRLILPNKGRFKEGKNTIILDPYSETKWVRDLSQTMKNANTFVLSMAISHDESEWSSLKSTEFIVRKLDYSPRPRPRPERP